jgi:hypothetical protein
VNLPANIRRAINRCATLRRNLPGVEIGINIIWNWAFLRIGRMSKLSAQSDFVRPRRQSALVFWRDLNSGFLAQHHPCQDRLCIVLYHGHPSVVTAGAKTLYYKIKPGMRARFNETGVGWFSYDDRCVGQFGTADPNHIRSEIFRNPIRQDMFSADWSGATEYTLSLAQRISPTRLHVSA